MGIADLGDVERAAAAMSAGSAGTLVGSTPLLAAFAGRAEPLRPGEPALLERDLRRPLGEPRARALARGARAARLARLPAPGPRARRGAYVDYRATQDLRRPVLEALAGTLFSEPSHAPRRPRGAPARAPRARRLRALPRERRGARLATGRSGPSASAPARSRSATTTRPSATTPTRSGSSTSSSRRSRVATVRGCTSTSRSACTPTATTPGASARSFALGASGGAPPDQFFSEGQEWGFPPLHPQGIREDRLRYPIACLRRCSVARAPCGSTT